MLNLWGKIKRIPAIAGALRPVAAPSSRRPAMSAPRRFGIAATVPRQYFPLAIFGGKHRPCPPPPPFAQARPAAGPVLQLPYHGNARCPGSLPGTAAIPLLASGGWCKVIATAPAPEFTFQRHETRARINKKNFSLAPVSRRALLLFGAAA